MRRLVREEIDSVLIPTVIICYFVPQKDRQSIYPSYKLSQHLIYPSYKLSQHLSPYLNDVGSATNLLFLNIVISSMLQAYKRAKVEEEWLGINQQVRDFPPLGIDTTESHAIITISTLVVLNKL
jgi:hypothetical protein